MSLSFLPRKTKSALERISTAMGRNEVITADPMIFVGGMSRSGTTLLATVFDSHPEIVCGAELIPGKLPPPREMFAVLDHALSLSDGDFGMAGRALRHEGDRAIALFLTRCYRAGVTEAEFRDAFAELAVEAPRVADTLGERLRIASRIIKKRAEREAASLYGFKFASASPEVGMSYFSEAYFVGIIRDPLDVVLSHQKRGFDKSVPEICKDWSIYAQKYRAYCEKNPERAITIRYEDLVRSPQRTMKQVFDRLPVDLHANIFAFYESDSPIHAGHHPNAERLRSNFATDGIGRGRRELPRDVARQIDEACANEMEALGYDHRGWVRRGRLGDEQLVRISEPARFFKRQNFARKRKFDVADYETLLAPYIESFEIMPLGQYVREPEVSERKILVIRHDVDHDAENAIKIGAWEAEQGLKTTYCLLHTAWYYGHLENGRYRHSDLLVETVEKLAEQGHEINFHNNLVTLALTEDVDPIAILEQELEFFDRLGVPVTGTATHGDALCRELEFRNWEIFRECCDDRFGGPRTVTHHDGTKERHIALGEVSMFDLGLEYEGYDIAKDIYHTESGGNMRTREDTFGRRPFGRSQPEQGTVHGILTHPIWWKF